MPLVRSRIGVAHGHDADHHDDHGGLQRDLLATGRAIDRRSLLRHVTRAGLGYGALQLLGCNGLDAATAPAFGDDGTTQDTSGSCSRISEETAGPYPGDGSNGANVLNQTGVVRQDIRSSFAGLNGTTDGVPLSIDLSVVHAGTCAPLADYAVYLWHCDRVGRYSLYTSGVTNQNWLRGVQAADSAGRVRFTSVFPGCYTGRWPHIHFEVFRSVAEAGRFSNRIATSQLALPKAACDAVYAGSNYASSRSNLAGISLATDNVFRDGSSRQLATVTGDTNGMVATLTVAVTG